MYLLDYYDQEGKFSETSLTLLKITSHQNNHLIYDTIFFLFVECMNLGLFENDTFKNYSKPILNNNFKKISYFESYYDIMNIR